MPLPNFPQFEWDADAGRYRGGGGRFVAGQKLRGALDDYLEANAQEARGWAEELRQGRMSIREWQSNMEKLIVRSHLNAAALGRGGAGQMDAAALEKAGDFMRSELGYLQKLAIEVEFGLPLDGRFLNRARQYALAPRAHYHGVEREEKQKRGFTEERSVRHKRDSCFDCSFWASVGWRPIGTITLPGERECRRDCGCLLEYRKETEAKSVIEQNDSEFVPASPDEFITARNRSKRSGYLSPIEAEDLKDHRLFLAHNGKVGYGLDAQGDLQNVFNNGGPQGSGSGAVVDAIHNGVRTLDCYDGFLPNYYSQHGFVVTGRMSFVDEYAPEGWNIEENGRPDVVFMAYQGGPRESIEQRIKQFARPVPSDGRYYDDWDQAKDDSRAAAMDG